MSDTEFPSLSEEFRDNAGLLLERLALFIERIEQAGAKASSHVAYRDFDNITSTLLAIIVELIREVDRLAGEMEEEYLDDE